jgi:hypothetical protein
MASEDSFNHFLDRSLALLTVHVHPVSFLHNLDHSLRFSVLPSFEGSENILEELKILESARERHVAFAKGQDNVS